MTNPLVTTFFRDEATRRPQWTVDTAVALWTVVAVGERALALYERPDGRYDVFASQWAGEWAAIAAVLASDGTHPAVLDRYRWERRDAGPRAALLADLDYLSTAAVYELSPEAVRVSVPVWLGLDALAVESDQLPAEFGVLVPVNGVHDAIRTRLGCRWLKAAAGRAVETGLLSVPQAVRLLVLFLLPASRDVPPPVAAWLDTASVFG